jgi:hypothetical protein
LPIRHKKGFDFAILFFSNCYLLFYCWNLDSQKQESGKIHHRASRLCPAFGRVQKESHHPGSQFETRQDRLHRVNLRAPIYTAYEKDFFKDEGLEPELVKCSCANYKDNLALYGYDIVHHLVLHFLKPIAFYALTSLLIDHWLEIASESSCLDPLSWGCRTKPIDASSFSN